MPKVYADAVDTSRQHENNLSFWYPKVKDAGIATPQTFSFKLPAPAGSEAELGWRLQKAFFMEDPQIDIATIQTWLDRDVIPVLKANAMTGRLFVKNGTFSNKFWAEGSCIVNGIHGLASAVANINYSSLCVGAGGTGELTVRKFIGYDYRKTPCIYNGLPLRAEFRVFYDFDERVPIFVANYWEPSYVRRYLRDLTDQLVFDCKEPQMSSFFHCEKEAVVDMVVKAMKHVNGLTGQWSVDVMWDSLHQKYWLIDMAIAQTSAFWECRPEGNKPAIT